MINSLWISKTGMEAQQTQLDVISNNLANVSTNGFKKSHAVFEDLMYQNLRQVGANSTDQSTLPTGLQVGLGVRTVATSRDFASGGMQQTGNPYDLAVQGTGIGFFQVTMPDGTVGYTRDGSFSKDAQGRLVTKSGLPLSPGITIPANATSVTIANDGTVSAEVAGSSQNLGSITLANFINPAGLDPKGQNLYSETAASGQPQVGAPGTNGLGSISQGWVETSNVNVVQELVSMIQTQRAYEMNSKAIQTSDQMLQKLGQL
jgi:flagellar basal-body rod protein FlgG